MIYTKKTPLSSIIRLENNFTTKFQTKNSKEVCKSNYRIHNHISEPSKINQIFIKIRKNKLL